MPEGIRDASSCWDACERVCDGGLCGGGGVCSLQVWTYLASGYSDDKICGAGDLTVVFRKHRETCLNMVCLKSVSSLTTNPPPSPPTGHRALV